MSDDLKLSIVIPYKQRLDNIRAVFTSLVDQTMDRARFEVVVGVMEYAPEYVALCREFTDRLSIVSVLTTGEWNTSRARNLGIRHASGQIVMVLDADVVLAPVALENLYERHFRHGQNVCVLGQVFGYDEVVGSDVETVQVQPYDHYRKLLADLETADRARLDPRWSAEYAPALARFPWAFARTGLMALPTATVRAHGLLLDEDFPGWGPEDQEWGLRISRTGTPLVLGQDVYGLHLPHRRDFAAQDRSATLSNRYYLAKWPRLDLELALAFGGWLEADRLCPDAERELARASGGRSLGVVRATVGERSVLFVGAVLDASGEAADPEVRALLGGGARAEVLPLAGFALPFADRSVDECRVLAPVARLSERYRDAVHREAERVACRLLVPAGAADR
ncbi:glycosyltransferase family 2 protein [Streptomyces sp. MST-110588]|uniref:glycosyltransferase family 2 protein n=1 Tax=Streptomyces sp. MST-110588 TaxID=2833628 RepID=UPI001F5DA30A|nr:glycosyltransferase family 2 protein [Streptomyces sp. MST-110588]UNO39189.1 glycosyltransferase family 2 protein [Streptomyces sp. MST-110588]